MYPNKLFVREKGGNYQKNKYDVSYALSTNLKGNEAKTFYEDVLKLESKQPTRPIKPTKLKKVKTIKPQINKKDIFKFAETNNTEDLSQLISDGVDLNVRDSFNWTPLMCAACSGALHAVELLVNAGCDKSVCDGRYNAVYLAKKNGHKEIVKILTEGLVSNKAPALSTTPQTINYCKLCKQNYSTSKAKHEASTSHLIELNSSKTKTFYGIPESNRGFQMLLRNGWNRDRGLGPEGSGRKFPIKPSMKKDRTGIGCTQQEKKQDNLEIRSNNKVISKFRSKEFERNFRLQFS